MLSEKAQAAAAKIKSLNDGDLNSLSESIRHEVEHATHVLGERAKEAEIKLREFAENPDFDKLGRDGMRFDRFFTTAPVCSASRSAFMTGMYQTTIGAQNHRSHRDDGYTLPAGVRNAPCQRPRSDARSMAATGQTSPRASASSLPSSTCARRSA